jgi:hypothetical protein
MAGGRECVSVPSTSAAHGRPAAARSKSRSRARVAGNRGTSTAANIRWDRLGSLAMLFVLGVLVYLYLSAGIHMLSTWKQARSDSATVTTMERENRLLERQHETLKRRGTQEEEARRRGMMKSGEQAYIVSGLPGN